MAFYQNHGYPNLVKILGDPKPIANLRRRLLPDAMGTVLELGFGPGVNFSYYDAARVSKLYALEPSEAMIRIAQRHPRRTLFDVEFLGIEGERIPLDDRTIDTVVSTFTLCTVPGPADTMRGIARVLRPGGSLIFVENTASPDRSIRRWQEGWAPIHQRVFCGLQLTRDVPSFISAAGFSFKHLEAGHLAAFPKSWAYCCWGVAVIGT